MARKSRIGFRYHDQSGHYRPAELKRWLPDLAELSAGWLVLPTGMSEIVPEPFISAVQAADIRPIVHLVGPIGPQNERSIRRTLSAYARYGVREVIVYDKPNLQASWSEGGWVASHLIASFIEIMLPIWSMQVDMDMSPIFPPLQPGGDYWDTAFLEAALIHLQQQGHEALLKQMKLAAYAWTYGKALDWGAGGPARWPQARPYHSQDDVQDQLGLGIFDWYESISSQAAGIALPMLVVAGGSTAEDTVRPQETAEIIRMLNQDEINSMVKAFAFPLFGRHGDELHSQAAWQEAEDEPQAEAPEPKALAKRYQDYILLPPEIQESEWPTIAQFAQARGFPIGFSTQDAAQAERVWIIKQIPDGIEQSLLDQGCQVSRSSVPANA